MKVHQIKEDVMKTNLFKRLLRDTKGATAIEYGLIAALIAVAGITAMSAVNSSDKTEEPPPAEQTLDE